MSTPVRTVWEAPVPPTAISTDQPATDQPPTPPVNQPEQDPVPEAPAGRQKFTPKPASPLSATDVANVLEKKYSGEFQQEFLGDKE